MICVIQRVNSAVVYADGALSGAIEKGLYLLLGVKVGDDKRDATLLAEKISKLRIFSDENGKTASPVILFCIQKFNLLFLLSIVIDILKNSSSLT